MDLTTIIQAKLKLLMSQGVVTNVDIEMGIEEVAMAIRNYCNRELYWQIPEELKFTWANMVIDLVKYTTASNLDPDEDDISVDSAEVSSVKIGDTQIQLGGASSLNARASALKSHTARLDDIVMNYKYQLQRFRRFP